MIVGVVVLVLVLVDDSLPDDSLLDDISRRAL